jgi:hypothetical protein
MRKSLHIALVLISVLAFPFARGSAEARAGQAAQKQRPAFERVAADVIVVRPLGAAGLALGTAATIVAMPVTIPKGKTKEVSRRLMLKPYEFTFRRPLGVW